MSEREQGGVEYESPEGEPSEDASSAIGPVLDSTFPSTIDLPDTTKERTGEQSTSTVESAAIGAVLESPGSPITQNSFSSITSEVTEKVANGNGTSRPIPAQVATEVGEDDEDEESEDGDDEEEEYEDGEDAEGDDEEDDDEEDDDEEDEEEEDEEPVLKYSKIEGAAADILEKDAASAIAVGATYFAVGTHNGLVHLFTLRGALLKSYRPHSASITDMCISSSPPTSDTSPNAPSPSQSQSSNPPASATDTLITDTIATTSLDGHAILHTLRTGTTTGHNFKRPLRSIALSPSFTSSPAKAYVCGGMAGDLVLTQRSPSLGQALGQSLGLNALGGLESILTFGLAGANASSHHHANPEPATGPQTQKAISAGDGPIWIVRWHRDIIAWAVDAGVRLYSVAKGEKIAFIERVRESPRADLFLCSLTWSTRRYYDTSSDSKGGEEYEELLIGWADLFKVVRVWTRHKATSTAGSSGSGATGGGIAGAAYVAAGIGLSAPQPAVETVVELTKVLRLDCMIAGVAYWPFLLTHERKEAARSVSASSTLAPTGGATALISSTNTTTPVQDTALRRPSFTKPKSAPKPSPQATFLLLSYLPTKGMLSAESSTDHRRQPSNPPELRIVTSEGEERNRDVLAMKGSERWSCGDYRIVESFSPPVRQPAQREKGVGSLSDGRRAGGLRERDHGGWLVLSPKGVVLVRKRDRRDRVMWLVEREQYEEALEEMEKMELEGGYTRVTPGLGTELDQDSQTKAMSKEEIGIMYLDHLFKLRQYEKAAKLCPKVLGGNGKAWEDWIFQFAHAEELSVLVPFVPFKTPQLSKIAYGIILVYYLSHDTPALSRAIKEWPSEIYDIPSLINAIPQPPPTQILMECIADLYIKNRQPGKALPYFLRLRRPNVFQLIRDNNLFTDVQDQALLLVEFDQELMRQKEHLKASQPASEPVSTPSASPTPKPVASLPASAAGGVLSVLRAGMNAAIATGRMGASSPARPALSTTPPPPKVRRVQQEMTSTSYWTSTHDNDTLTARRKARGEAIPLLVENSHSIPIRKVVSQLEGQPYFLYLYLDALFEKDPQLSAEFLEKQVELYAEYAPGRVIRLLQSAQNLQIDVRLEKIYKICEEKDMVPEMVWTRSRMGDNKGALYLIIDRLGDVNRAIDFAKERKDDDLWEDFLRYSETRPNFIKGLLENVSTEIDPIRIIRRIRNGLEIPGLKESLIKILQDFNLQTSLMEGCESVLTSDCAALSARLQRAQVGGFLGKAASLCPICKKPIQQAHQDLILVFLCGHMVHAHCTSGGDGLPKQMESSLVGTGLGLGRDLGAKIAYAEMVKRRLDHGCPVHQKLEQGESATFSPPPMASHHSHTRRHR